MAESPSRARIPTTPTALDTDTTQYWCYHCDKRVSVETLPDLPDVICHECKNGFVESIPATPDHVDATFLGSPFLQLLRLIAQAGRDEDGPQQRTQDPQSEDDFSRIEVDGWKNDEEDDDDVNENEENRNDDEEEDENENENEDDEEDENESENEDEEEDENENESEDDEENEGGEDRSDNENEENIENEDEEDLRWRLRDMFPLVTRARTGRNWIPDWTEILMGLDDNSIEFRLEVPDRYIGNPEDYVDAAGYETLLQNLAETDGGRRGAPPAAKSAVLELPTVEILSEQETIVCAICKDMVNIGETATKLPCGHGYHGDCIVPWLGSRNTCPVCRFELPTDDHEYEEERKKRAPASVGGALGSAGDNSSMG